jgi:pepF/M3 family oligoendopeptidase
MSTVVELPRWDMTVVYPSLESPEFENDYRGLIEEIGRLSELFDRLRIAKADTVPIDGDTVHAFETVTRELLDFSERSRTLGAYISSFITTDSRDDMAQARMSELQQHNVRLAELSTRYTAWIGSIEEIDQLIQRSELARDHEFMLRKTREEAEHLMAPGEESLAAELGVSGGSAWAKLHGNLTSQLLVRLNVDGKTEELPMSVVRNMAYDPDRETRRRAYEAEIQAWEGVAVPLAAALNSIKGESNTLSARRGWGMPLDVALFNNNIDRQTLGAMMQAARESFPIFRRYLHAKAKALGLPALAWYDLFAPVGESERTWEFDEASAFLVEQFGTYSPRMADYADRAFRESLNDAEPRPGKRDGAFCMSLRKDESRILTNYKPTYEGMSTLAHELGHGYHNFNLAQRTMFQRNTPMTLAETASIFCETIVRQAALDRADRAEQISISQSALEGACQVVVDIVSRFDFEKGVCEKRQQRELSVDELNELMLDAQRQTYGDGLDQNVLHPYMWAVKGHYYGPGRPFYNFPYMFGLLFGLGLYAQYQQDPERFRSSYDELLSSTGLADAATLCGRFGFDIRSADFWRSSLDIVRQDVDRFEALVDGH